MERERRHVSVTAVSVWVFLCENKKTQKISPGNGEPEWARPLLSSLTYPTYKVNWVAVNEAAPPINNLKQNEKQEMKAYHQGCDTWSWSEWNNNDPR